jgi:hypothetical protein
VVPGNLKEPDCKNSGINTSSNSFVDVFFFQERKWSYKAFRRSIQSKCPNSCKRHNHLVFWWWSIMMKGAFISDNTSSIPPPTRCKALKSKVKKIGRFKDFHAVFFLFEYLNCFRTWNQARKSGIHFAITVGSWLFLIKKW